MCTALERLEERGREAGRIEGREEGRKTRNTFCVAESWSRSQIAQRSQRIK